MKGFLRILWIATTPLAFTVLGSTLLTATAHSQEHGAEAAVEANVGDRAEAAGHQAEGHEPGAEHEGQGEHHLLTNPIQNTFDFGYAKKDVHGGSLEPGEEKMPAPFGAALINFGVLVFILGKFAAPSIAKMTSDRHDEIAKKLAESTKLRDEARAKLDEYTRKVAGLQAEIDKLVGEIRADAEAEKKRIVAEAEARAVRIEKDAQQQIQAEIQRVTATLEKEAVVQAVAIAEKLLRDRINEGDQRGLADKFSTALDSRRSLV